MPASTILGNKTIAEGTMSFSLEKPAGFTYAAGQHIDMTLPNPPETDAEGNTRAFSLVTSPSEDHLMIATRLRDTAFKRVLRNLPAGSPIELSDPMGSFTLHKNETKPAVFLMGGIGITPIMSIVKDATERALPHKLFLFYSNRRPEDSAFLAELQALEQQNPNFKLVATMTEMEKSSTPWDGETGFINAAMIRKYVPNGDAMYYLSGPPAMVKAMRGLLTDMKVDEDGIKTEEFAGY